MSFSYTPQGGWFGMVMGTTDCMSLQEIKIWKLRNYYYEHYYGDFMISGSNIAAVWQFDILESKLLYHKKGTFSERNDCIVRQSYERDR